MVIIRGVVLDAKKSTDTSSYYINGASVTYGSVTTSSVDGFFEISSAVVDSTVVSISKERFASISMDLVSFGKKFDPNSCLSGTALEATSVSGQPGITTLTVVDTTLASGAYTSSAILVTGGINSGQTCYIISNTENSFNVGF